MLWIQVILRWPTRSNTGGTLEILASAGLAEKDLQNAKDKPLGEIERRAWGNHEPTRLAMNCSGKHAGMLATCVAAGWPTQNYLDPEHPLQIAIKKELEKLAGEDVSLTSANKRGSRFNPFRIMALVWMDLIVERGYVSCVGSPLLRCTEPSELRITKWPECTDSTTPLLVISANSSSHTTWQQKAKNYKHIFGHHFHVRMTNFSAAMSYAKKSSPATRPYKRTPAVTIFADGDE